MALDIVHAIDAPIDFAAFFAPTNLALMVRWANQYRFDNCDFSLRDGALVVGMPEGTQTVIAPPPKFDVAEFAELRGDSRWR